MIEDIAALLREGPGEYQAEGSLAAFPLTAGHYVLRFAVVAADGETRSHSAASLTVRGPSGGASRVSIEQRWRVSRGRSETTPR
jgi:hypothetical protein